MSGERMAPRLQRAIGFVASVGSAGAVLVLVAARPPLGPAAANRWGAEAPADTALLGAATLAAWLCLGWVVTSGLLMTLSALPGVGGRIAEAVATVLVPVGVRRTIEAALGLTVVTMPVIGPVIGPVVG